MRDVEDLAFSGELWSWRGPSPYHFVTVPEEVCAALRAMSSLVSYGWGMIKDVVRKAERLVEGDTVTVQLSVRPGRL